MKTRMFEGYPTHFDLQPYEGAEVSGVKSFYIDENYIIVEFKDKRIYLYNNHHPGKEHVEEMKNRALNGNKLGTYINQNIRENYFAYWDKTEKKFKINKMFN